MLYTVDSVPGIGAALVREPVLPILLVSKLELEEAGTESVAVNGSVKQLELSSHTTVTSLVYSDLEL